MRRTVTAMLTLLICLAGATDSVAGKSWEEPLKKAVQGCDRLRVRSGGTCHRDPETEKTLIEVTKGSEIRALIKGIEIDESESGGGCMCCGEPTFEFMKGEKVLAMVGFHHGQSLRWADGSWPGDGTLTGESTVFLCRWLADRGVTGPQEALDEGRARELAAETRRRRYHEILPGDAFAALVKARSRNEAQAALSAAAEDPIARALFCMRVYGCHEGGWSAYTNIDSAAQRILQSTPGDALGEALALAAGDPWAMNGAARLILGDRQAGLFPPEALAGALPEILNRSLAHPRERVRRSAMGGSVEIGGPTVIAALRKVLAGEVEVREQPESDRVDPGGMVTVRGLPEGVGDAEDDRVAAACALTALLDTDSVPAMRSLYDEATAPDRLLLEECLQKLRGDK